MAIRPEEKEINFLVTIAWSDPKRRFQMEIVELVLFIEIQVLFMQFRMD